MSFERVKRRVCLPNGHDIFTRRKVFLAWKIKTVSTVLDNHALPAYPERGKQYSTWDEAYKDHMWAISHLGRDTPHGSAIWANIQDIHNMVLQKNKFEKARDEFEGLQPPYTVVIEQYKNSGNTGYRYVLNGSHKWPVKRDTFWRLVHSAGVPAPEGAVAGRKKPKSACKVSPQIYAE